MPNLETESFSPGVDVTRRHPLAFLWTSETATMVAVVGLWWVCALQFAAKQEIWVDETTQLSGLKLGPFEVVSWLAGKDALRFGLPGDRAPPLAYWLGWLWTQVMGLSENAMRSFGITCVAVGLVFLVRAARRAFGPVAGLIAGLLLALSPNVIDTGINIRSYPLYLMCSCMALWAVVRIHDIEQPSARDWAVLALVSSFASFTHFFGLVLSGVALVACAPVVYFHRSQLKYFLLSSAMVAVSMAGLAPFVLGAQDLGGGVPPPLTFGEFARTLARLGYRLLGGHPALAVYPAAVAVVLFGSVALIALALSTREERARRIARSLALGVVAGILVLVPAKVILRNFDAFTVNYNSWALPFLAVLCGAGVCVTTRALVRVAYGLSAGVVLASVVGVLVLTLNGHTFANAAGERIYAQIEKNGGISRVTVLHHGHFGYPYFPLFLMTDGKLPQYMAEVGPDGTLSAKNLSSKDSPSGVKSFDTPRVLLVSSALQDAAALAAYVRSGQAPHFTDARLRAALISAGYHSTGSSETLMAFGASEYEWFSK